MSWTLAALAFFSALVAKPAHGDEPRGDAPAGIDCSFIQLVGAKDADRDGNAAAPSLETLRAALLPTKGSPFARYADTRFLRAGRFIEPCYPHMGFRYSDGDRCSVEHLEKRRAHFGPGTAVLMSSGGAHSIAMATLLVQDGAYQPIWKMGSAVGPSAVTANEQDIATLRYEYPAYAAAKPAPSAPPVFIMDQHRGDKAFPGDFDNRAEYRASQYPSPAELRAHGLDKLIWIVEGKTDEAPVPLDLAALAALAKGKPGVWERYDNDPILILRRYIRAGLDVSILHLSPYDCPYSHRKPDPQ